ncbi:MAG: methyltransferase domain-containing protein [Cyanobacteria bacterium P01_G01_bin.19]
MKLDKFKQEMATVYDRRRDTYDTGKSGKWHQDLACRLVKCVDLKKGQKVLDLATGTGMVAIEAAEQVGSEGQIIGVDISEGLLSVAKQKSDRQQLTNITFKLADIETLEFPENSFDRILCCSALPLLTDVPQDLRLWRKFLNSTGKIGLCVFAETAFVHGVVLQKVARRYGVNIVMSDLTGTPNKCNSLLLEAGYKNIQITTEQYGSYIPYEPSKNDRSWDISLQHPHCHPLLDLSSQQLEQVKAEYIAELEVLVTEKGIWNDMTTYFVVAAK